MNDVTAWLIDPWTLSLIVSVASVHPLHRIFRRAGLNPWPSLLVLLPLVGWPAVGSVLAFRHWPAVPRRGKKR
jgi:hypothetical protein